MSVEVSLPPTQIQLPNPFDTKLLTPPNLEDNAPIFMDSLVEQIQEGDGKRKPNFPSFCPLAYHNISQEIPQKYLFLIRITYITSVSFTCLLIFSFISQCFLSPIVSPTIIKWREVILSLFEAIMCPSSLFYGQYYPLYCSFRDQRSNKNLICFQIFTLVVFLFFTIGIPGTGIIGFGYAMLSFRGGEVSNRIVGVICTIWHIFHFFMEMIIFILEIPLLSSVRSIPNPADI